MRLETIHLTLAFLGEIEAGGLAALEDLKLKGSRHVLPIEQARYWPHHRIIWAGPAETPEALLRLARDLHQESRARGVRIEERAFAAHVTLIRNARLPGALPALPSVRWPVEECLLVESRPSGAGRDYAVLARYALN
jgi:2'-5' RNA ligase